MPLLFENESHMKKIFPFLLLLISISCTEEYFTPNKKLEIAPNAPASATINDIDAGFNSAIDISDLMDSVNGPGLTATQALDSAIDAGNSVFFPNGEYTIDDRVAFSSANSHYLGASKSGVILKYDIPKDNQMWDNCLGVITAHNVKFENITFSGNNLDVDVGLLEVGSPDESLTYKTSNTQFHNCVIKDIKGTNTDSNESIPGSKTIYGVRVWLTKARNFSFNNVTFENISAYGDDEPVKAGFAGGVLLWSNLPSENIGESINGSIIGCHFKTIFTENNSGDINLSDADGIRLFALGSDNTSICDRDPFNLTIRDNVFEGVEKSAIKIGAGKGIIIENTTVKSTKPADILDMMAAIRIQSAIDVTIDNTIVEGHFKYVMNLVGQNITVDGIQKGLNDYTVDDAFDGGSSIIQIQQHCNIQNDSISISNIEDGDQIRKILKLQPNSLCPQTDLNISLNNVNLNLNMTYDSDNLGGGDGRISIKNVDGFTMDNVKITDWSTNSICVSLTDSKNITISNSNLYARETGLETRYTTNSNIFDNVTIDNTTFKRSNYTGSVKSFVYLRPLKKGVVEWGKIGKVVVTNSKFYSYGFDVKSNQDPLLIGADEVELVADSIIFTPDVGDLLPHSGIQIRDASKVSVQNIGLNAGSNVSNLYAVLAIDSEDSDAAIDIQNITSTNAGVWLLRCSNVEVDTTSITSQGIKLKEN